MGLRWNAWSLYWLLWLVVGFIVPESIALARDVRNTLSYQVWHLEGGGLTVTRYIVAAFTVWLFLHFVFRWFI